MQIEKFEFFSFETSGRRASQPPVTENISDTTPVSDDIVLGKAELEKRLADAERRGYEKGLVAGVVQGETQEKERHSAMEKELSSILTEVARNLTNSMQQFKEMQNEALKETGELALAIARKIAGELINAQAETLIISMIKEQLETLHHSPVLTIHVNETIAKLINDTLAEAAKQASFDGEIIIKPSATMAMSDCRIEWQNGLLERSTEKIISDIQDVVESFSETTFGTESNTSDIAENSTQQPME